MLSITTHSNSKLMKIVTLLPNSWGFLESAKVGNGILSDRFATTPINQAHALATLLNEGL